MHGAEQDGGHREEVIAVAWPVRGTAEQQDHGKRGVEARSTNYKTRR
jgi:hypothetical protein